MTTMDIQSALALVANHEEKNKFFKGQVRHFNLDGGSSLKDYLDRINNDAVRWLRDLPKSIKSKPRFHKYKAPIYALLVHKDVVAAYGQEYCSTVLNNLKNAFRDRIDEIINERTQSPAVEEDTPESILEQESDDDGSVLDIDSLEVATPGTTEKKSDETVDYKQQYELMKVKYDALWREYNTVKGVLSKTFELLGKMASK
jgi:hypothetical protein